MTRPIFPAPVILACLLALAACGAPPDAGVTRHEDLAANPLYAEFESDNVVETLTNLEIENDPALKENGVAKKVRNAKEDALAAGRAAKERKLRGWGGTLVAVNEEVQGSVLVEKDRLWTSPDFYVNPSANLHAYLSGSIDPRGIPFPAESDLDLGTLPAYTGAQGIAVPPHGIDVRSVVLWDADLKRIFGFAQVHRAVME